MSHFYIVVPLEIVSSALCHLQSVIKTYLISSGEKKREGPDKKVLKLPILSLPYLLIPILCMGDRAQM